MNELMWVKRTFTENTGGGFMVDFIELQDGRIIAISDELIALYKSMDDFYEGAEGFPPHIRL